MAFTDVQPLILATAQAHGYDPALLAAQAHQESRFNPSAVSPVGARGLMQFMPATWADWGQGRAIEDPAASLDAGARYMSFLISRYKGLGSVHPVQLALAAYNWGMGHVDRVMKTANRSDWDGVVAYLPAETQSYVPSILGRLPMYRAAFGAAARALPGVVVGVLALLVFSLLRNLA
jgi:soluble lytic murein transglycosylase-like protein